MDITPSKDAKMRKAKIAGAVAWYLECPKCGSEDVFNKDTGSDKHVNYWELDKTRLICEACNTELAAPKIPKRIKVY